LEYLFIKRLSVQDVAKEKQGRELWRNALKNGIGGLTMENLNADQIVKALECCSVKRICTDCPYFEKYCKVGALHRLEADALSLIKELTEENATLHASCTELERKCASLNDENERLSQSLANTKSILANCKADTVRKMHAEIKERCIKGGIYPAFVARTIDQIAKERLERENEKETKGL
jgi:hypothetical protein